MRRKGARIPGRFAHEGRRGLDGPNESRAGHGLVRDPDDGGRNVRVGERDSAFGGRRQRSRPQGASSRTGLPERRHSGRVKGSGSGHPRPVWRGVPKRSATRPTDSARLRASGLTAPALERGRSLWLGGSSAGPSRAEAEVDTLSPWGGKDARAWRTAGRLSSEAASVQRTASGFDSSPDSRHRSVAGQDDRLNRYVSGAARDPLRGLHVRRLARRSEAAGVARIPRKREELERRLAANR